MAGKKKKSGSGSSTVCRNKRASQKYDFEEHIEAGLVLRGSEVKSLRAHRADLEGAYASIHRGEGYLYQMHIAEYAQAGQFNHEVKRPRKLLLQRRQIERLQGRLTMQGYTLVPLAVYFSKGFAKVDLALARGKRLGDKRDEIRREVDLKEAREAISRRKDR